MTDGTNQFSNITRYSDQDLAEFQELIEKKIAKATRDLSFMEEQIENLTENMGGESDWMDETSSNNEREMLFAMASRQRRHIQDLNNALVRIHNKSYGICIVTGELIDKRRLLAVPTTTKSLAAKTAIPEAGKATAKPAVPRPPVKKQAAPKIISKVISKKSATAPKNEKIETIDDDWDDDDEFDVDIDFLGDEGDGEVEGEDDNEDDF